MSASLVIEEECGTFSRRMHRHNGYYAGDFSGRSHANESGVRLRQPRHVPTPQLAPGASSTSR